MKKCIATVMLLAGCTSVPIANDAPPGPEWPDDALETGLAPDARTPTWAGQIAPRSSYTTTLANLAFEAYQATWSRADGPTCRFHPTCSAFAREAIARYGLAGIALGFARLQRNHADAGFYPIDPEGRLIDPVDAHAFWFDPQVQQP